jgi:hypothetical protein
MKRKGSVIDMALQWHLEAAKTRRHPLRKRKMLVQQRVTCLIRGLLQKVPWFGVILDEAQSIKNYRTQVARLAGVCEPKEDGVCLGNLYRMLLKISIAIFGFSDTTHMLSTSNFAP